MLETYLLSRKRVPHPTLILITFASQHVVIQNTIPLMGELTACASASYWSYHLKTIGLTSTVMLHSYMLNRKIALPLAKDNRTTPFFSNLFIRKEPHLC